MGGSTNPSSVQESPLQLAQSQIASSQWDDYKKRWTPVTEYYINRTQGGLADRKQYSEGAANTNVQEQYGKAQQQVNAGMASHQVQTGSDKQVIATGKIGDDRAQALGLSKSAADSAVTRQYEAGLQGIVSQGRGQQATSDQSLSDLSDLSGKYASASAENAAQSAAGAGDVLGTAIGAPLGYGLSAATSRGAGTGMSAPTSQNYNLNQGG